MLGPEAIRVFQDETLVGEARRAAPNDRPSDDTLRDARLIRGRGLYGVARVKSLRVDD